MVRNDENLSRELEELLAQIKGEDREKPEYIQGLYMLMCAYEAEEKSEKAQVIAHDLINMSLEDNCEVSDEQLRGCYDVLARSGDFEAFMIAMEWNRPLEKKFYLPRRRVFKEHGVIDAFQAFCNDELDLLVLNTPPRVGKMLADNTPILTKDGWKNHGDLEIGDELLNDKGDFVRVLAVSPKYMTEYTVTFSNGATIDCHGNHEWIVYDRRMSRRNGYKPITLTTSEILKNMNNVKRGYRYGVLEKEPIKGIDKELLVDPYVLGVWLGDGTTKSGTMTENDEDAKYIINECVKKGYSIKSQRYIEEGCQQYRLNNLLNDLHKLGLCFDSKFLPEEYLTASIEQRLELLAGLIDTDGNKRYDRNALQFCSTNKDMFDNVVTLVESFGWKCRVWSRSPKCNSKIRGKIVYSKKTLYIMEFYPTFYVPCRVPRKRLKQLSKSYVLSITNISPVKKPQKGNCIQVEGGIYLAGKNLIPTHNSTLGMFLISFRAGLYPEQSILGSGHSTSLMNSFYREFLNFVTSDEYRFKEIFINSQVVQQNAEYTYIDLGTEKRFHTVNFRSVDAGSTGLVEYSNFLYLDDLVKDAEQANSKDRLDKLFSQYTSTLKDRGVQRLCKDGVYRPAPQVFIGTPWSIYDVMSRIINDTENYGDLSRVRIVKIPCWDENHKSNFEYDYGKGFSVKYYEDMERVEDPVIFSAKYLQKPIEREGRPFEKDALSYYTELPLDDSGNVKEPDRKLAYNDVAHGGDDFMCMPIAYIYGYDVYIEDVLFMHNFGGDAFSRPKVCDKIIGHNIRNAGFEKNNGGDFYASLIRQDLLRLGYRCNIQEFNASTKSSKLDRILSVQNEIKGVASVENSYRVHFKDPQTLPVKSEYMEYLRNIWGWSQKEGAIQKKQHDDGPDGTAGLLINMLGLRNKGSFKLYDIREAGY